MTDEFLDHLHLHLHLAGSYTAYILATAERDNGTSVSLSAENLE